MPNSFQNDESISVVAVSLPELPVLVPRVRADEDEGDRRFKLADGDIPPRTSVALIPSSPTVACRISSKNVQRPSRRSDAICLPVRIRASRDGGGMVLRHCVIISSVGFSSDDDTKAKSASSAVLFASRSIDNGSVADRGGRFKSVSGFVAPGLLLLLLTPESVEADSNDSIRACEP